MSTKTAKEIQTDIFDLIKASPLANAISGGVYRAGLRPRDSKLEDITVSFVSGLPNQIQTGIIAICIYVPDIDPYGNGAFVEDGARTELLERLSQNWLDTIPARSTDYVLRLQDTITTIEDEEIKQHFVSVMLHYEYCSE